MLENTENLELQIIKLDIASAGQIVKSQSVRSRAEHKKIKGLAILSKGGYTAAEVQGLFTIKVDKNQIISDGEVPKFLFEVTHSKSLYENAYKCDVNISTSDIDIQYTDGSPSLGFSAYSVNFILICEKKK